MKTIFQFAASILTPLLITAPMRAEMQSPEPASAPQIHISVVDRDGDTAPAGSETTKGFTVLIADSTGAPVADSAVVFRLPDEGASGCFADLSHSAIVYTGPNGLAQVSGVKWGNTPGDVAIKILATKGAARAGILLSETLTARAQPAPVPQSAPSAAATVQPTPVVPSPQPAPASPVVQPGASVPQEKALARPSAPVDNPASAPAVSVLTDKKTQTGYHSSHKKWIILAAVVAAAAGAGLAMGGKKSKSGSSTPTTTTGVSVGTPTISVGQP